MRSGTAGYEEFMDIVMRRHSCRDFPDRPIPEGAIEKILEAARWAMSGADSQPWSYIVVTDKEVIHKLFEAHIYNNMDYAFWLEQQRSFEMRHPGFMVENNNPDAALKVKQSRHLWRDVPAVIVTVGDGRKQFGSLICSHTSGGRNSHLTDAMSNTATMIHLAAASLGLSTQWVTVHVEGPYKRILGIPDELMVHTLIPVGYPTKPVGGSWREQLKDIVHYNHYDMEKHLSNKEVMERLKRMRVRTKTPYKSMII